MCYVTAVAEVRLWLMDPERSPTDPTRLFLYDDPVARNWQPFSLTRPIGEVLFGTETLRARIERVFGVVCCGHLAGDILLEFEEPGAPGCTTLESTDKAGTCLYLNSRFVPEDGVATIERGKPTLFTAGPAVVGACVPRGTEVPRALLASEDPPAWPMQPLAGRLLDTVWGLMIENSNQIRSDGARFAETGPPAGVHQIGSGRISVAEDVVVEPGVLFDTSRGPIILSRGARVQAPARIAGPLYLGPDSRILGGVVGEASIGPACRVRGEVESCVILGFSNKAHDGFLGHSVVGRWVNLGAMTSNSDLKNTYSPVRLLIGGRETDTALLKVGCFLGDHTRTAIGTLLATGTVVGSGSNLFGGGVPPRDIPPFSWAGRSNLSEYDLDGFLETAARVMARRGVPMTDGVQRLYRKAFAATAPLRTATQPR